MISAFSYFDHFFLFYLYFFLHFFLFWIHFFFLFQPSQSPLSSSYNMHSQWDSFQYSQHKTFNTWTSKFSILCFFFSFIFSHEIQHLHNLMVSLNRQNKKKKQQQHHHRCRFISKFFFCFNFQFRDMHSKKKHQRSRRRRRQEGKSGLFSVTLSLLSFHSLDDGFSKYKCVALTNCMGSWESLHHNCIAIYVLISDILYGLYIRIFAFCCSSWALSFECWWGNGNDVCAFQIV